MHLEKNTQDIYKLTLFTYITKLSDTLSFMVIQILPARNIMQKQNYSKKA